MQLPKNHQEIVDRFVATCQADERIVAAFLGGSHAQDKADKFSDLDLFFITIDEAYETIVAERKRLIHLLGEPLVMEDFGAANGYFVFFANGTEAEIWFGHESKFSDIYEGPYKTLLDKKGILAGVTFPVRVAESGKQTELLNQLLGGFWHELSHFIKAMGRRQLWFAYGQLEVMRQICVNLARLKHDYSDPYLGEEPYFKVEQILPIEKLSPLETTYCPMEFKSMLDAAQIICRFYQNVAPNLAKEHNLSYQTDLDQIMTSHLRELAD